MSKPCRLLSVDTPPRFVMRATREKLRPLLRLKSLKKEKRKKCNLRLASVLSYHVDLNLRQAKLAEVRCG